MKKSYIFVLLIILLSACNPSNNPAQPVDVTQTASITSTSTPVPTETRLPTTTKVPATRTPTPVVPMTTYFDKETGIQISYPAHWVEKSHRFFSGNDGYLLIKNVDDYHSKNLWHVAVDFANTYYPYFAVSCIGFVRWVVQSTKKITLILKGLLFFSHMSRQLIPPNMQ